MRLETDNSYQEKSPPFSPLHPLKYRFPWNPFVDNFLVYSSLCRYPKLKKKGYYQECDINNASHLYVMNHDDQPTYPSKHRAYHHLNKT